MDGHNHAALLKSFSNTPIEKRKPTCIIARTVKGKGASFAEDRPAWHHGVPSKVQLEMAAQELGVEVS
jgi:transketolase